MPSPLTLADAPSVPVSSVRWSIRHAGALWVLAQLAPLFIGGAIVAIVYGSDLPDPLPIRAIIAFQIGLWVVYGLGPIVTTKQLGDGPVADLGARITTQDIGLGVAVGLATQIALIPLYIPIGWFVDEDPSEAARELVDRVSSNLEWGLLTVMVVVAAPLVEELFYRGLVLRALQPLTGTWPAIIIQAAVFAFSHLQPLQFAGLFVFGVVAGWLAVKTGRLGASWAMHVAFNGLALVLV